MVHAKAVCVDLANVLKSEKKKLDGDLFGDSCAVYQ